MSRITMITAAITPPLLDDDGSAVDDGCSEAGRTGGVKKLVDLNTEYWLPKLDLAYTLTNTV